MQGLVSIHDVMPETLDHCRALIQQLRDDQVDALMLLVVPGKQWSKEDINQLQAWQNEGIDLAGHGWQHEAEKPRSLYHKAHSLLLSRMAAEHLSLNADGIRQLMENCFQWFVENELRTPSLYVPPAWALGGLSRETLAQLPFREIEVLGGVLQTGSQRYCPLPLAGYEADTLWRATNLRAWNAVNAWRARRSGKPLRIGIHPYDADLRLSDQMQAQIRACDRYCRYSELF